MKHNTFFSMGAFAESKDGVVHVSDVAGRITGSVQDPVVIMCMMMVALHHHTKLVLDLEEGLISKETKEMAQKMDDFFRYIKKDGSVTVKSKNIE